MKENKHLTLKLFQKKKLKLKIHVMVLEKMSVFVKIRAMVLDLWLDTSCEPKRPKQYSF